MSTMTVFMGIMAFYAIISYVIGPMIGYYAGGRSYNSAGMGFVFGSLISIFLWFTYGKNLVNK